jgi:hypothetical protein
MLKLIAGKKGSGKTKKMIAMVNDAVNTSNGKIVCIEKGTKLTFDINHNARLLNTDDYNVYGLESFYGFIAGIAASDFDVKEIYIDSIANIVGDNFSEISTLFEKLDSISNKSNLSIYILISHDKTELPESIAKFVSINLV